MSIKLNDTQLVLLSAASQRDDHCLVRPAGPKRAQAQRAVAKLLEAGLLKEIRAKAGAPIWRRDDETGQSYALKLTAAGAKAIAVDEATASESMGEQRANHPISVNPKPEPVSDPAGIDRPNSNVASTPTSPRGGTKIAQVIELLQRGDGATLAELVAATGWLPHTTRAALTGLRKRGYAVGIDRADKVRGSVYRIEPREMEEDSAAPHAEASQTCEAPPDRPGRAANLRTGQGGVMATRRNANGAGEASVPPAPSASARETLDASVARLSGLNTDQLRLQWRNHLGGVAPAHLPRWLLLRVLAYRIQAAAFGDLARAILRRLHEHREEAFESRDARPFATRGPTTREGVGLKSGALLVREWNGRLERVMILDDGCAWNGCVYRSLSQVAKAITGTNWNGHRFFGLKAVRTGASNRKRNVIPRPDSLLDIGVSPTLAGFAPAMPDRSPPLATKESDFGISERIGLASQPAASGRRSPSLAQTSREYHVKHVMIDALEKRLIEALKSVDAHEACRGLRTEFRPFSRVRHLNSPASLSPQNSVSRTTRWRGRSRG